MDRAVELRQEKEINDGDMTVLWYLLSSIDRRSGEACRRTATIADRTGRSERAVRYSLARLEACGLVEREAQFGYRTRGQRANVYTLRDSDDGAESGQLSAGAPAQDCRLGAEAGCRPLSRCSSSPILKPSDAGARESAPPEPEAESDLSELADKLARSGDYRSQYGFGFEGLAYDDLTQLRNLGGFGGVLRCLQEARQRGLYGAVLREHVESRIAWLAERSGKRKNFNMRKMETADAR